MSCRAGLTLPQSMEQAGSDNDWDSLERDYITVWVYSLFMLFVHSLGRYAQGDFRCSRI